MKNKKIVVITVSISILLALSLGIFKIVGSLNQEPTILISNNTDKIIDDLKIKYTTENKIVKIPKINPKEKYKYIISIGTDDSINIIYKDKNGNEQEKLVSSYITKGMNDIYKVDITTSTDNNIIITVKQ